MRSLLLSAVLLLTAFAAQAQQNYGIAYQAVARDADGDALENAMLDVRFTLTDAADAAIWTETHTGVMTDGFGLITLAIGSVEGADGLASVDWADGGFAFLVEVNSGDGFESFGTMAVTSVPVALFAAKAPEPKADSLAVITAQEAADRAAADAVLQGQIDGNDSDITSNDTDIATNATGISTNATAISGNTADIDANDADIATNASGISTNASGIAGNVTAISNESTARAAADSDLQDQIDNLPSSVPSISAIVEDMLDPTQAGAGLAADGSYFTNTATNYIGTATNLVSADELLDAAVKAVQDDVDANELVSDNAESVLSGRLDILENDPTTATALAGVQSDVDANQTASETADMALQSELDASQAGSGLAADGSYMANAAGNHISTAISLSDADDKLDAAVKAVQDDVDANEAAALAARTVIQDDVDSNEAAALAARGVIQSDVDSNEAAALAARGVIQSDVDSNEAAALAARNDIQADVDLNEADGDADRALIRTEFAAADAAQTTTLSSEIDADVLVEKTRAEAAEAAIQSDVDSNEAAALAARGVIQSDVDANEAAANAAIAAADYFDQDGLTLKAGAGETWTGIETIDGAFGTVTTGSMTTSGDAQVGGTMGATGDATLGGALDVTGASTLSSTLDVTGATEFDSTLGVDGNFRIGSDGATKFSVEAATGTVTVAGDLIALTGGVAASSLTVTGASSLQSVSASSMSVSTLITVPAPTLGSTAANKSYVDGEIADALAAPQAFSYLSDGSYTAMGADLGASAVTITVTGANLAEGEYKLHLDGNETTLTVAVLNASTVEIYLTDTDVSGMTSRTGLLATQLSIDGIATGLNIFVNL